MTQEQLPSYLPYDHEIIKETQEDGTILFKHPIGGQIKTDDIDLYSAIYDDHTTSALRDIAKCELTHGEATP